jgi:hypothetical protein
MTLRVFPQRHAYGMLGIIAGVVCKGGHSSIMLCYPSTMRRSDRAGDASDASA